MLYTWMYRKLLIGWITRSFSINCVKSFFLITISHRIHVFLGLTQESKSNPFNLFVNDLSTCVKQSHILMFADYVKIFRSVNSTKVVGLLRLDLSALYGWYATNGMSLNLKKFTFIYLVWSIGFALCYG